MQAQVTEPAGFCGIFLAPLPGANRFSMLRPLPSKLIVTSSMIFELRSRRQSLSGSLSRVLVDDEYQLLLPSSVIMARGDLSPSYSMSGKRISVVHLNTLTSQQ